MGRRAKIKFRPRQLVRQHPRGGSQVLAAAERGHGAAVRARGHADRAAAARRPAQGHTGPAGGPAGDQT